jgi:uncharacterized membrane protein YesL
MNVWDGKAFMFLQKGTNIVLLNLLWFICSIPIFTIGPSTVAKTGVIRNWHLNQDISVFRGFFTEFQKNFKQSLFVGNVWLCIGILLLFDVYFFLQISSNLKVFLLAITFIALIFYLMTSAFLVIIFVHYDIKGISVIKHAFKYALLDAKTTLAVVLMWVAAGTAIFYSPLILLVIIVPVELVTFKFIMSSFDEIETLLQRRK